jgi:integrase
MPALPGNTYRTSHGYQFRVVVPEALRTAIGKREIKKSLGTDYHSAVSQARLLALQVDQQFRELRQQQVQQQQTDVSLERYQSSPIDQRLKPVTEITPELVTGLKSLWLATLDADLAWRREGIDDDEYEDLQANIRDMKQRIAHAIARGKADPFIPVVRNLLIGRGYHLAIAPEDERQLVLDLLPALQEGYDILEQRQNGRLVVPPNTAQDALPAAWESPQAERGLSWNDLVNHWCKDRPRPEKTLADAKTFLKSLQNHFPKTRPDTLTRAQVTDWLRHERETRGNSAKTLEKKGTIIGAMFSIAVKDELLDKNPFSNFDYSRFAAKEGLENPDEREPFSQEQLQRIFSTDEGVFSVHRQAGGGGYHARVWIPMLALLTGARLDEIGSLTVADILIEPVPHLCIRKGKTQSSVRDVPLHPTLIQLGFLKYVSAIQAAGHTSLWPALVSNSEKSKDSEVLGKWFNRFIHDTLKMPATVVFHSFRHTFKDLCRDALIPRDLHHALTGHASDKDEKNVGDDYGKGFSLETKLSQIKKIKFPFKLPMPEPYEKLKPIARRRRLTKS